MNTFVWIMVMFAAQGGIVTGPEFKTQQLCEKAAEDIKRDFDGRVWGSGLRKPHCVRIEK